MAKTEAKRAMGISLTPSLIERIDRVAGPGMRSRFIRECVMRELGRRESENSRRVGKPHAPSVGFVMPVGGG